MGWTARVAAVAGRRDVPSIRITNHTAHNHDLSYWVRGKEGQGHLRTHTVPAQGASVLRMTDAKALDIFLKEQAELALRPHGEDAALTYEKVRD